MTFTVRWPDGERSTHYSPSLVVSERLAAGRTYGLDEFLARATEALAIASDRVRAKYGMPCSRAQAQSRELARRAARFGAEERVTVEAFGSP